jgi:hypothetical protein
MHTIKGRGIVATVTLEANHPNGGDVVQRVADGARWTILGVDWWAMPRTPERPGKGDQVGLLVATPGLSEGDEVIILSGAT